MLSNSSVPASQNTPPINSSHALGFSQQKLPSAIWGFLSGTGIQIGLNKRFYLVGRHKNCDVVISNARQVSNRHCEIELVISAYATLSKFKYDNGKAFIRDISSNGTKINGETIKKNVATELRDSDLIEFVPGTVYAVFKYAASSNTIAAAYLNDLRSDDYVILEKELGRGTYAFVNMALNRKTGKRLACKIIKKEQKWTKKQSEYLKQEIGILRSLTHPNIITLIDHFESEKTCFIFLDFLEGGDLFDYVVSQSCIEENETRFITHQMAEALSYLHQRNVSHRDLKPENVLLRKRDSYPLIVLTDFGLAKIKLQSFKTVCGTVNYMAPEIVSGTKSGYDFKVDCWSLGVVVYVMLAGSMPFNEDSEGETLDLIRNGQYVFDEAEWSSISSEARDIVGRLLQVNPELRLSIEEVHEHEFLRDYREKLDEIFQSKWKLLQRE